VKKEGKPAQTPLEERIRPKLEKLPYGDAPGIQLPSPKAPEKEISAAITRQFKPLAGLPAGIEEAPGPDGQPLTLTDLQKLGLTNSPVLRQAAADVEAARGGALQARLYPNPNVGLSFATMGPGGNPINGGLISGTIKGPGKLRLAFDAANYDAKIAEIKLKAAQFELFSMIRSGYFEMLVARENLKINKALVQLTDEVYEMLKDQFKGGVSAAYETMQLRVIALQVRAQYVQAHNRYLRAWKQLAATLGLPGMPLTQLAGRVDMPIPRYRFDSVLAQILVTHTDVLTARMLVEKHRSLLAVARSMPIPDTLYNLAVLEDNSPGPGPFRTTAVVTTGWALPIWDRNQGGIQQAQGNLLHYAEENHRVRSDLTSRLADAFERYEDNRILIDMYRKEMLPNQVQAFRSSVQRHSRGPVGDVGFLDLVVAEQTLVSVITSYIGVLHDMWFATVDVAALLQTPDLFQVDETIPVHPVPDLEQLCALDCLHRCSPIQGPNLRKGDGNWPIYDQPEARPLPAPRPLDNNKLDSKKQSDMRPGPGVPPNTAASLLPPENIPAVSATPMRDQAILSLPR
jgi:cobalt-zinc-cadmium efflux system outer membrane protein